MHAVEGSGQQEEDSSDEVEVVDEPQLHRKDTHLIQYSRGSLCMEQTMPTLN